MAGRWAVALSGALAALSGGCAAHGVYVTNRAPPAVYGATRVDWEGICLFADSSVSCECDPFVLVTAAAFVPLLAADLAASAVVDSVMLPYTLTTGRRKPQDQSPPASPLTTDAPSAQGPGSASSREAIGVR